MTNLDYCPYSSYNNPGKGLGIKCLNCEMTNYENCFLVRQRGDVEIIDEHKKLKVSIVEEKLKNEDVLGGRENI